MINNQPIIIELITALEVCCRQASAVTTITGRPLNFSQLQTMVDNRVEEFKNLYYEIPAEAAFIVEAQIDGFLLIRPNEIFREFAEQSQREDLFYAAIPISSFINNTLH